MSQVQRRQGHPQENSDSEGAVVEVIMKVVNRKTNKVLYDSGKSGFTSTTASVLSFLKEHDKDFTSDFSGYAGDVSNEDSSDPKQTKCLPPRLTFGSTISTIPPGSSSPNEFPTVELRPSMISSISSDTGRVLSSTRIEDKIVTEKTSSKVHDVKPVLSNGNGAGSPGDGGVMKTENASEKGKLGKPRTSDGGRGKKRKQNERTMSESSSSDKLSNSSSLKQEAKRPRQLEEPFDSSSNEGSISLFGTSSSNSTEDVGRKGENGASIPFVPTPVTGSRKLEDAEAAILAKSVTLWGRISIGEWVFARWRDKNYYSGQITAKGMNDTWHIHFEDNMDDVASETHILPIKIIGVNVKAVYSPDNIYKPYVVSVIGQKFSEDGQNAEYAIKGDGLPNALICQRKQLSLKESEAKALRKVLQAPIPKAADLNFDNIVSGPRRRGSEATPHAGGSSKKVVGGAFDASSADEHILKDSGVGTPTPKKATTQKPASVTKSNSTPASDSGLSDSKQAGDTTQNATPSTPKPPHTKDPTSSETPKGALKDSVKKSKGKNKAALFDGMQFFLTASGGGDPASSGHEVPLPTLPYDKDEYRDSIETRGGKVVDHVGKEKGKENVYLISDSHARTVKYIYCLAAGIPCVSHLWLGECLKLNMIVDWKPHELKSGWSLEKEQVIPAHNKRPLKNLKIFVTGESDELYNYWKPVLTAAEATLLKPKKKSGIVGGLPPDAEVVVTDSKCTQEFYDKVRASNIPMVMPEWLVQSIITGERASYTGHKRYEVNVGTEDDE